MDDFFGKGYIFNQDDNEESATEDENEDTSEEEEMYSPDEDESFSEEI